MKIFPVTTSWVSAIVPAVPIHDIIQDLGEGTGRKAKGLLTNSISLLGSFPGRTSQRSLSDPRDFPDRDSPGLHRDSPYFHCISPRLTGTPPGLHRFSLYFTGVQNPPKHGFCQGGYLTDFGLFSQFWVHSRSLIIFTKSSPPKAPTRPGCLKFVDT